MTPSATVSTADHAETSDRYTWVRGAIDQLAHVTLCAADRVVTAVCGRIVPVRSVINNEVSLRCTECAAMHAVPGE